MTVVLSSSLVMGPKPDIDLDNPLIGWHNLVTPANVGSGDGTGPVGTIAHPTTNLANPSTYQKFQTYTGGIDFWIDVVLDGTEDVDYFALAGHNLGTMKRSVQLVGAMERDSEGDLILEPITELFQVTSDTPLLIRFPPKKYIYVGLDCYSAEQAEDDIVYAAVMYVGRLLVLERKIQVTFTPLPYGRRSEISSLRSERGQFLGRVVTGEWSESTAVISHLSPDWYRTNMDKFLDAARKTPFFFAWAPMSYPNEVGYAWLMEDAVPEIHTPLGHIQVNLAMQGIVK